MSKITFIGAGSTVFAKNLLGDILSYPELADSTISLHDIDPERLRTSVIVAEKIAQALGVNPTIEASTDRRKSLAGSDYAIAMFQVGGFRPSTVVDFEIPKRYGLRQTIADTLGIGGIMRGLRTIPVLTSMARDMEELCPDVTFLQYVNPMAMNMWALDRASTVKSVGLCHSVPHTAGELAKDIGIPVEEIDYKVAGINHVAFYLKFEHKGRDLYPEIRRVIDEGRVPETNQVRYKLFEKFGYFVTESSEHFSEYGPWFIKRDRPDLIEQFNIPLDEYIRRCEFQLAGWEALRDRFEATDVQFRVIPEGEEPEEIRTDGSERDMERLLNHLLQIKRSVEYGSQIIYAQESGTPAVIYGNVGNHGLIDNLPAGCCVEVPCLVDRQGIQPTRMGSLPPQLAALMQTNINVQALTVEAALTGKRDHIYHAAMLDPHTAAELDMDQITNLVDDLIEAHGDWLPEYK
ncbi:MAG: alpha-glucosidase/alpha-galactosidase [Caldilineaceae bacterium]|nr:alpha-glucosidase/alpha-galactosidase [Caldilineaceae bacterium]MBP8108255.1 alpha-glucosidase/alpha-galactosidase [Caldilineaceae bacterium]MBP8121654.1 alpha-glucosidase/alpha-galactosidase [Caldilineaceae bacterium]MBP9071646.1 alpha-glucosidase/alpha-galactosidase [Caldilineaceae bacterium]